MHDLPVDGADKVMVGASAALAGGAATMYRRVVRPWMYAWGARADEVDVVLPGDDLVSASTPRTTRAVSIDASIEAVWPWLVQIGEDRGGFYSYDWLERAVGAHIHNTQIVHPECQELSVGDSVWLARRYGQRARQVVADIEPKSHLVLMSEPGSDLHTTVQLTGPLSVVDAALADHVEACPGSGQQRGSTRASQDGARRAEGRGQPPRAHHHR